MNETTERDKQVEVQLKQLEDVIGGLGAQIDHLVGSLDQVLSEESPSKVEDSSTAEAVLCPLADQIRSDRHRLQRIDKTIINLLSRLEI